MILTVKQLSNNLTLVNLNRRFLTSKVQMQYNPVNPIQCPASIVRAPVRVATGEITDQAVTDEKLDKDGGIFTKK